MKNWFSKNLKNIIIGAFVVPILLVAFVSISHVTSFYGISNPLSWAIYLSVGIEIAALSALAAVSVNMGRFVYLPFFVVTLIQMLGNIFFSFTFIDENSQTFQDWISMVGGLFENMGVEKTDLNTHKTILSFLTGGLLPIISLTFAHMLVKFSENQKNEIPEKINLEDKPLIVDLPELIAKKQQDDESLKYTPTKEDLDKLEQILKRYPSPEEKINDSSPVFLNEEELENLEKILKRYEVKQDEIIENQNTESQKEDTVEDNFGYSFENLSEFESINNSIPENIKEQIVSTEDIVETEVSLQEPITFIEPQPVEIETDKKKIFEESEKVSNYKVLSYLKRNG